MNGSKTLLFRRPGIAKVLRVINKFVNDTVLLIPANITATINKSWLPTLVNFVLQEKGVINAQPAVTDVLSEHLVTYTFLRLSLDNLITVYQNLIRLSRNHCFMTARLISMHDSGTSYTGTLTSNYARQSTQPKTKELLPINAARLPLSLLNTWNFMASETQPCQTCSTPRV